MTVNRVHIKNFKSIVDLSLEFAPVNVFIGDNGSGKSNILEALAFAAAAAARKLDNEFLASRGIRVTEPRFMRSAFAEASEGAVSITVENEHGIRVPFEVNAYEDASYPRWRLIPRAEVVNEAASVLAASVMNQDRFGELLADGDKKFARMKTELRTRVKKSPDLRKLISSITNAATGVSAPSRSKESVLTALVWLFQSIDNRYDEAGLDDFIIYSPEISALRTFEKEGQILPLGIRGEGLLKLLRVLASEDPQGWSALQSNLGLLDWFSGIEVDHDSSLPEQSIRLRDRFMAAAQPAFDQRSANEGFLYLLFFFALIVSKATPRFFAIENVDTSLNPKACSEFMRRLAVLALEHGKQILFTTHNPSLLDGLNLHDDQQRLFVVFRNKDGHTVARRVMPPKLVGDEFPMKLSEAFTRGILGGTPQNF